jgi:hypothetical protein
LLLLLLLLFLFLLLPPPLLLLLFLLLLLLLPWRVLLGPHWVWVAALQLHAVGTAAVWCSTERH